MRIFVVYTDDRAISESLRAALPETDVLIVEHSIDALKDRLTKVQPDALLIDDTPSLRPSDFEALMRIRMEVPAIVISARFDLESQAAFIVAGAKRCIGKPFDCDEFSTAVTEVTRLPEPSAAAPPQVPSANAPTIDHVQQHRSALKWMSRSVENLDDPNRLAHSVVEALVDVFDTARAAIVLIQNGTARISASRGIADSIARPLRLSTREGLMAWLDENGCLFDRRYHPEAYDAQKQMGVLGARLAFPIVVDGQTRGAVLLGEKLSGSDYSNAERELLSIMTRSLAASLQRAKHIRDSSRQQHRLDAVISSISTGVVTVRPDKTVSMLNESAERILHVHAADVLGKSVQNIGSAFADLVLQSLRDGKPRLRKQIAVAQRNSHLGVSVTPLGDEGVAAIFTELPAHAETAAAMDDSSFWEYLSSRVAQEIKNPMVAINTFAQLLPAKYDSKGFRDEFAAVVQGEVARINAVVESLYSFARKPELHRERRDFNASVKQVIEAFEEEIQNRGMTLETTLDADELPIEIDPGMMDEAIRNVIRNSLDAMGDTGTLQISTQRNNGWCELVVADSGPGVGDQDAPYIFMPFYSTKERGMGLGLTMAHRIVDQHHGELELTPPTGDGGRFTFRIPTATQEPETAAR